MDYIIKTIRIRPNCTIEGLIRFYNSVAMEKAKLKFCVEEFNKLNPQAQPPRPGMEVTMPVLVEYKENTPP